MYKISLQLFLCVILSSCASMKSKHIVGTQEPAKKDIIAKLKKSTTWKVGNKVFEVRSENSKIVASTLIWDKSKKEHVIKTYEVALSTLENALFLNIKNKEDELYTILFASLSSEGSFALYSINADVIEKDMKEGVIKASKNGDDYTLTMSKEKQDEYIEGNVHRIFDYRIHKLVSQINKEK